ncbi:MAG TPA: thioredoxin family protein [Rhizomicrobium sp.]|nr:thioredoxin family protein [Rhizomicrobium sp.]
MLRASVVVLIGLVAALPAAAQIDAAPKVQARLVGETGEAAPGGTLSVALEQDIRPGWHTYWLNPGEAGLPTTIEWSLPAGWHAGAIQWPYPKRLPVGPLMDYGYEGKPWLLSAIAVPKDAAPGMIVTLKAHASWLVCQNVCVPEDQTLSLPVSVSTAPAAPYATVEEQFAAARAKIPAASPWPVSFHAGGDLDLYVASPSLAKAQLTDATFFPSSEGVVTGMAPQQIGTAATGMVLRLKPGNKAAGAKMLSGVLVLTSADGSVQALSVDAKPGAVPPAQFGGAAGDTSLALALLFAFLGGLILNLMPCVLPILAMKALAIASKAHGDKREAAREGFAYGAGAIASFVALGLAIVALRAGGAAVGWGFQLQEPAAVAAFALLIFAVGLNLSGVFEFANVTAGDALTRRGGVTGSFFTGVLAVAVAAPCTAPFMAAALGYALTQSAATSLLVFLALGLGFALPFVLIGLSPRLLAFLPKPGGWMLRFKQLLAFPMYGAAAWLVWVLTQEAGSTGLVAILAGMIALAFAAWSWSASREADGAWRTVGGVFAGLGLIAALAVLPLIHGDAPVAAPAAGSGSGLASAPYSAAHLAQLRAAKQPVFVDVTAAWCITCLVNEKVALSGAAVRAAFARKHVTYLVADWTSRNAEITALLEANGRSGVPLYLYYAPGADAAVLPQVLTEGDVLKAIGS